MPTNQEPLGTKTGLIPPLRPVRSARVQSSCKGGARVPHGRYDERTVNTRMPPGGTLGSAPRSRNTSTAIAAVTDPMGDGEQRILATINRAVDVLEQDRSRKLISEAAYRTGRLLQGVLEYSRRIGSSNWAGVCRKDPGEVRDTHAQRMIDDGRLAESYKTRMRDRLGMVDTRLLTRILGDGLSFAECARLVGKAGDRGHRYVAARYRDALEELAEAWTAKGKVVPPPADKHLAAAGAVTARQEASIEGGATLERLESELAALRQKRPRDLTRGEVVELAEISARVEALRTLAT